MFNVIDAFDIPRFKYSGERKKYLPEEGKKSLFGAAPDKPALTRNRYALETYPIVNHFLFIKFYLSFPFGPLSFG